MQEIGEFAQKLNIKANGMKKYMAFILGKELFFIDGMQLLNFIHETLLKILPKDKFKCMSQQRKGKRLELQKTKRNVSLEIYKYFCKM